VDWTPEDFTGFWKGLTRDAEKILSEIAEKPKVFGRRPREALGLAGWHICEGG